MEAGFVRVVEVGQYFMTKDTGDFRQFRSVACREYTLTRDDPASQPKGWIQGNMRIGPVLEVTTSSQNFKYGIESAESGHPIFRATTPLSRSSFGE